ncbi:PAS domain-containing sensor histidine kinase [Romboutsia weinsteinii]|uniref:histidine kinase n=1 Tax=Romboutsia weinsteinii TaxID=2020949 RepID=A0A371JAK0_9FIRM|nr:PAS domain-containing sensor histidine kinase [Romboutsia weinsteinii]RDY29678.1 PAS domain-containing sensor histidine kinase [Romboutsia weinsteinii]
MDSLNLRENKSRKYLDLFYVVVLLLLLTVNYIDSKSYSFIIIITRSSLITLIFILVNNRREDRYSYIYFIGIGYILSNIFDILVIIAFTKPIIITDANIIMNLLEIFSLLFAIKYRLNKIESNDTYNSIQVKGFVLFTSLILFLLADIEIFNFDSISISTSDIVIVISILIVVYTIKQCKYYVNSNKYGIDRIKDINKILILKIVYLIYILFTSKIELSSNIQRTGMEMLGITQIYLVYKIIIHTSIIDPYVKIIDVNKEIDRQSKLYEGTNSILEKMDNVQLEINKKIIYKDDFLDSILKSTPNGWGIFDESLNLIYSNPVFKNILNYEDDIIYSIDKNVINSKDFKQNIAKVCREKINIENEIEINNGKVYKCSYRYYKEYGGCICILLDITYEKSILNYLMDLKEEYEDLIVNIKRPVFICDENDNLIKSSKFYEDIFDSDILYISREFEKNNENKSIKYKIHPEDIEMCKFVKRINKKAKDEDEIYNNGFFRYRVINKYGEVRWLESNTTIDYEDDKRYTIISYSDITKYIKTRDYLEKTQNMYKDLLDSIPEGIYLEDLDTGRYMFVNEKFMNIFSVDKDINKDDLGICRQDLMSIHSEYEHVVDESISTIKENKVFNYVNLKYLDVNGKTIDANVASIPFKVGNKTLKLTIIKDMMDIKYLESLKSQILESKKYDRLKMEFFINMSHELKTPLNLIFTSTQLLENLYNKEKISSSGSHLKNHIELTKQNSFRLLKIINDLIDFTKMESGFYKIRMESKDIILAVEDIVMSVVSYAQSKDISLIFDTDIEELIMNVDVNAIERILLNILSNAIKFTDLGGSIYVNIYYKGDKIDVAIEDTGIGIPEDKIDFIFERFNDVNKGFIGNVYGSGIGLSMVKSIGNLIGADVKVESEYGKGTKFTISLSINNDGIVESIEEYKYEKTSNVERLTVDMADIYK